MGGGAAALRAGVLALRAGVLAQRAGLAALRALVLGPLWPLAALSGLAWMVLIAAERGPLHSGVALICTAAGLQSVSSRGVLAGALLMIVAMMLPLTAPAVVHVWTHSLAARRTRAVVSMLIAYVGVWAAACAALSRMSFYVRSTAGMDDLPMLCAAAGLALAWQGSAAKRRLLNRCHALPPLPVFGAAAEIGSLRLGALSALRCIGACWALMALPIVAGPAHLLLMAGVSLLMLSEQCATPRWPRTDIRLLAAGGGLMLPALAVLFRP